MLNLDLIKDVTVSWMEGYGNSPSLRLEFHSPYYDADWYKEMRKAYRYQRFDQKTGHKSRVRQPDLSFKEVEEVQTLWWAENDLGFVSFYGHSGEDVNEGGFGGTHIPITLIDGTEKVLKGPWSSRPGYGNAYKIGTEPWLECGGFAVKLSLYLAIIDRFLPDVHLFEYSWGEGQEWGLYVSASPDKCAKPSGKTFSELTDEPDSYWGARKWERGQ